MIILQNVTDQPEIFKKFCAMYETLYIEAMSRLGIGSSPELLDNGYLLFFETEPDLEAVLETMQIHIPKDAPELNESDTQLTWTCEFIECPSDEKLAKSMKAVARRYRNLPIPFQKLTSKSYTLVYPSIRIYEIMIQQELHALDQFVRIEPKNIATIEKIDEP